MKINHFLKEKDTKNEHDDQKIGVWFLIQWCHDIASDEYLNIGVGIEYDNFDIDLKMLDDFSKLEHLLGEGGRFHAELAISIVKESVSNQGIDEYIPNIKIIRKFPAQGKSSNEILERLYESVVTLSSS